MARIPNPASGFILGDSIGDILAEARIDMGRKRLAPGRQMKIICPACQGGSTREDSLSIKLDADGLGVAWNCKRGSCGWTGNGRIADDAGRGGAGPRQGRRDWDEAPAQPMPRAVVQPAVEPVEQRQRPASLLAWFRRRGISAETVEQLGIYAVMRRWPAPGEKDDEGKPIWREFATVVFPYVWQGAVVNRKFRSVHKQFAQDKDAARTLFNADSVTSHDEIIIVEGEMDVCALWEAGFRQVVSLPDGAAATLLAEDDPKRQTDQRFEALTTCAAMLAPIERVVIATDADLPGRNLAEEFARRLGKERARVVSWPADCKDANDVLLRHVPDAERGQRDPTEAELDAGRADLLAAIQSAPLWPLEGLWQPESGALAAFLKAGRYPSGLECGVAALDAVIRLPAGPGWLTVVTGIPSHGKSSYLRCWMAYQAMRHGFGIAWFSPEDNRPETLALGIAQTIAGQPLQEAGGFAPDAVIARAEEWIARHVVIITHDDDKTDPTLDWLLKRALEAKKRHPHLAYLLIDPWNEVEHSYDARRESETQYTGRSLRRLKAWGRAEGFGIIIAVHPQKLAKDGKGQYPVPELYDISGSANWANRADLGITIYRQEDTGIMQARNTKAKYPGFGSRNSDALLTYDQRTARFRSTQTQEVDRD
jgi:twinkle protein